MPGVIDSFLSAVDQSHRRRNDGLDSLINWYRQNWDDYEELSKMTGFSLFGIPARYRRGELEAEENARYWSDYQRNTGVDLSKSKYPIRRGYYSDYSYIGNTFESAMRAGQMLYGYSKPRYDRRQQDDRRYQSYRDFERNYWSEASRRYGW